MSRADRLLAGTQLATTFAVPAVTLHALVAHLQEGRSLKALASDPGFVAIVLLAAISVAPMTLALAALARHLRLGRSLAAIVASGRLDARDGIAFTVVPANEPVVCLAGWRQPSILVSQGALERMTPGMLRAALLHEEAHRRAGDHRWRPVLAMLRAAFGFLPGVDGLTRAMLLRSEMAADAAAIVRGAGRRQLFEAVIACTDAGLAVPALGGAGVEARLARIADPLGAAGVALPRLPLAGLGAWMLGLPLAAHVLLVAGVLCRPTMG